MNNLNEWNNKQIFVRDAMSGSWLEYAEELRDSSEILWNQHENAMRVEWEQSLNDKGTIKKVSLISRTYILLAGFAIENLVKGILVLQDPSHINNGKLSRKLKSHNLIKLISNIDDLALDPAEYEICKRMQEAIPYWGRYPIPLEYNGVLPEIAVDNNFRKTFLKLHERLGQKIYREIRDGWKSGVGPEIVNYRSKRYGDTINPDEQ